MHGNEPKVVCLLQCGVREWKGGGEGKGEGEGWDKVDMKGGEGWLDYDEPKR